MPTRLSSGIKTRRRTTFPSLDRRQSGTNVSRLEHSCADGDSAAEEDVHEPRSPRVHSLHIGRYRSRALSCLDCEVGRMLHDSTPPKTGCVYKRPSLLLGVIR